MVSYYLDTSAMLKYYVDELGSTWLRAQILDVTLLVSSELVIVEAVSAFNRRAREGGLSLTEYQRVRVRGYDAMHLATALIVNRSLQKHEFPPLAFLCADDHLNAAASAEGLRVDNPLDHAG